MARLTDQVDLVALPEPDPWLVGFLSGEPTEQERMEWHDQWHVEHANAECDLRRPRSPHRPGWFERLRRAMR